MSRAPRRRTAQRPIVGRPVVLVFAESTNDSEAVKRLLPHVFPALAAEADVQVRRDPPSLTRHAGLKRQSTWLEEISTLVALEARLRQVRAVLVHRDADGHDPRGLVEIELRDHLKAHMPDHNTQPVVPVQMIEGWWLLFPEAVRAVRPQAWRNLKLPGGDTSTITDPKKVLITQTKRVAAKQPYREADSLVIAAEICRRGLTPAATNASWDRFCRGVSEL